MITFLDTRFRVIMAANKSTPSPFDTSTLLLGSNISVFFIGILSILTNGTLLLITFLDPLKKFKRSSTYFITSLSFSDFITGITSCMYAFHTKISLNPILQKALSASIWVSVQNSFITILLMAVERLLVVKEPLGVRRIITRRRTVLAIAVTWIASVVSGAATGIPTPYGIYVRFAILIEFSLIILVMLSIYVRMLVLLKVSDNVLKGKKFSGNSRQQMTSRSCSTRAQHNLNTVVLNIAVILVVTVVPHVVVGLTFYTFKLFCPKTCQATPAMTVSTIISFPIELLHFVLNPIVYAWRLSEYRQSLRYYFSRKNSYEPSTYSYSGRSLPPFSSKRRMSKDDTLM